MNIALPYISIKPNGFTTYTRWDQTGDHFGRKKSALSPPTDTNHHGKLSKKANSRVRTAIDWLIHLSDYKKSPTKLKQGEFNFKLNFITLTLSSPQRHTDNEIKSKLLNQFLTELRQKHACKHYMWRAESQRNGNIHFHIVTDVFVPWRELRTDWNRIQEKLGYISRFTERTNKSDPNSTDVHAIKDIKNLSAYLSKYLAKNQNDQALDKSIAKQQSLDLDFVVNPQSSTSKVKAVGYRAIKGKLWGLSQTLSKLKSGAHEIYGVLEQEIEFLKKRDPSKVKFVDHACCYFYTITDLVTLKCNELVKVFSGYKKSILFPVIEKVEQVVKLVIEAPPPKVFSQSNIEFELVG